MLLTLVYNSCFKLDENLKIVIDHQKVQKYQYQLLIAFKAAMFAHCIRKRSMSKSSLMSIIKQLEKER